ncbi:hypothetical protein M758_UG053100 [Ceratodon purpureus]|nr:hypothetical protein M758_UG053100 [Ceratodon purpureus]
MKKLIVWAVCLILPLLDHCSFVFDVALFHTRTGARPSLRRDIHFATVESNVSLSLPTTHGVDVMLRCLLCLEFKVIYCSPDLLVYIL